MVAAANMEGPGTPAQSPHRQSVLLVELTLSIIKLSNLNYSYDLNNSFTGRLRALSHLAHLVWSVRLFSLIFGPMKRGALNVDGIEPWLGLFLV